MRIVLLPLAVALTPACILRATLLPERGETRVVLWDGARLKGPGRAEVEVPSGTPVRVVSVSNGDCRVHVPGRVSVEGVVTCHRLGLFAAVPADVHLEPGGPVMLRVNGGVLLAPRERKGDWIRIGGDALETFEGWVKREKLGHAVARSWFAPGLPQHPWVCREGSWLYDRPGGRFLMWMPGPWCRVTVLEEKENWTKIRYLDGRVRVEGWVEARAVVPDREPRFHPGARSTRVVLRAPIFGTPTSKTSFGVLEAGTAVWASLKSRGRTLVQTQSERIEVVGWVENAALE